MFKLYITSCRTIKFQLLPENFEKHCLRLWVLDLLTRLSWLRLQENFYLFAFYFFFCKQGCRRGRKIKWGWHLISPAFQMCSFVIFVSIIILKYLPRGSYGEKKCAISSLPLEIFFSVFVKSWKLVFNFNNLFITAISSFLIQKEFLPVLFFVGKKRSPSISKMLAFLKKNAVFKYVKLFIRIPLMLLFFRIFLLLWCWSCFWQSVVFWQEWYHKLWKA